MQDQRKDLPLDPTLLIVLILARSSRYISPSVRRVAPA